MPASSSRAAPPRRAALPFRAADPALVVVGSSSPARHSLDPPRLRRRLGGAASSVPAADPESLADSPDATRLDERLKLRRGGAGCRGLSSSSSGSANLRSSSSEDAFATCCTDTGAGTARPLCDCRVGVVAIEWRHSIATVAVGASGTLGCGADGDWRVSGWRSGRETGKGRNGAEDYKARGVREEYSRCG